MTIRTTVKLLFIFLAWACMGLSAAGLDRPATAPDKKEIISKARESYYVLQQAGLKTFHCNAEPNWQKFFSDNFKGQADEQKIKAISEIQFSVAFDEHGAAELRPFRTSGQEIDKQFDQLTDGIKQMLSGFFQMWSPIVFTNPLEGDSEQASVEQHGEGYRVFTKTADAQVEIELDKNYAITSMSVSTSFMNVAMIPSFQKSAKGLLMTGLQADINKGQQQIALDIDYQDVHGFSLPAKAAFRVTLGKQPVTLEVGFTKYETTQGIKLSGER